MNETTISTTNTSITSNTSVTKPAPMEAACVAALQGTRHRSTRKRKPDETDTEMEELLRQIPSEGLGPFWFHKSTSLLVHGSLVHVGLQQRERLELEELIRIGFITEEFLESKLIPLNDESSDVPRLRMYNWAVTNYAKGKAITTQITDKQGNLRFIDPSISYDAALKRLHRNLFDPYRRGTLLFFKVKGQVYHTTVGQLLFIKWCEDNGVDTFVEVHQDDIRKHLNETTKSRVYKGEGRVKELTESKLTYARISSTTTLNL
jgi:hypothetical protein